MPELSLALAARLLGAFLLGSIPFAVIVMWGTGVDITRYGSGNPGFNNVLRYSRWRAALCLAGDAGKGWLALWLCLRAGDAPAMAWVYGIAAVLGHSFSPWLGFRGGKGIATGAGAMLFLYPKILLPCVALYVALRIIGGRRQWTERGFIASISACVLFALLVLRYEGFPTAWLGFALLAFIVWRHKKNIQVLAGGVQQ